MAFAQISNSTIGVVQFLSLGEIQPADRRILPVRRPNCGGVAVRNLAKQGAEHRIKATLDTATPEAGQRQTQRDSLLALRNEVVTVTGAHGIETEKVCILEVTIPQSYAEQTNPAPIANASGGVAGDNATHLWTIFFRVIDTSAE